MTGTGRKVANVTGAARVPSFGAFDRAATVAGRVYGIAPLPSRFDTLFACRDAGGACRGLWSLRAPAAPYRRL
jgi:hypothetical protein